MILLVYLACPALHLIDAVPVNLSSNHSLLHQTGDDLTSACAKKTEKNIKNAVVAAVYLTINSNALKKKNLYKSTFLTCIFS